MHNEILHLINILIDNEVEAESQRQNLSRRPYFSIHDAFKTLDSNNDGYITMEEFREILDDYGIFATQRDVLNLMKRYDKGHRGKISYSDFVQETAPKSPSKYRSHYNIKP